MVKDNHEFLYTRYTDLFEDDQLADPALEQLIADLDMVYSSTSRPANLSEKLLPMLEAYHVQQADPVSIELPLINVPTRFIGQSPLPKRSISLRRWQRRINMLVAVALITLLVGSLLLVFSHIHRTGQAGTGPSPSSPTGTASSAGLNRFLTIHMLTSTTGWAQISNPIISAFAVLRTTDGGTHWQNVTPSQLTPLIDDNLARLYVLNTTTAWISDVYPLQSQPTTPHGVLFRTTDAGRTWQKITLPLSTSVSFSISDVNFFTAQDGVITTSRVGKGAQTQGDIWYTNNGGQNWRPVVTPTFPDTISNSVTFSDEKTWWLTRDLVFVTYGNQASNPVLYVTHDSGITWQQRKLPIPIHSANQLYIIGKPKFFSPQNGLLAVDLEVFSQKGVLMNGSSTNIIIYATHDGGATWQPQAPFLAQLVGANGTEWEVMPVPLGQAVDKNTSYSFSTPVFADMDHGWVYGDVIPLAGKKLPTTNHLGITSDGGRHWTTVDVQMPGGQKGQSVSSDLVWSTWSNPDFVSAKVGWLMGSYSPSTSNLPRTALFKTVDGGHTWTIVHYSIS